MKIALKQSYLTAHFLEYNQNWRIIRIFNLTILPLSTFMIKNLLAKLIISENAVRRRHCMQLYSDFCFFSVEELKIFDKLKNVRVHFLKHRIAMSNVV